MGGFSICFSEHITGHPKKYIVTAAKVAVRKGLKYVAEGAKTIARSGAKGIAKVGKKLVSLLGF